MFSEKLWKTADKKGKQVWQWKDPETPNPKGIQEYQGYDLKKHVVQLNIITSSVDKEDDDEHKGENSKFAFLTDDFTSC